MISNLTDSAKIAFHQTSDINVFSNFDLMLM